MAITIKNASLRKKVFLKMRDLDRRAIKSYERGDLSGGNKLSRLSENIYKKNYFKMFSVVLKINKLPGKRR